MSAESERPRKKRTLRVVLLAVLGVLFLCVVVALLTPGENDGAQDAAPTAPARAADATFAGGATTPVSPAEPAPPSPVGRTVEPTTAPLPSATPEPTSTPVPTHKPEPTATTRPTDTRIPAPTRRPSLTPLPSKTAIPAEERAYLDKLLPEMESVSKALGGVRALCADLRPNDSTWVLSMAANMAVIKVAAEEVRSLVPPSRFQEVHNTVLVALDGQVLSMDYLARGIDAMDVALIAQASQYLSESNVKMEEATDMMNTLMGR